MTKKFQGGGILRWNCPDIAFRTDKHLINAGGWASRNVGGRGLWTEERENTVWLAEENGGDFAEHLEAIATPSHLGGIEMSYISRKFRWSDVEWKCGDWFKLNFAN